ncbi:MAG: hypothetical protein COB53_03545 [Elusimicrobia bacterium]|nr:MAG: hypothetical protein COB53_03545 [Elusimicrobiota bacterium]
MTDVMLKKQISKIHIKEPDPFFLFLIKKGPLRPIKNKESHAQYLALVKVLMRALSDEQTNKADNETMRRYLSLLTPFIENFEAKKWPAGKGPSGREMLAYLIEQHDLGQNDFQEEIGTQPYVSAILAGKKNITEKHAVNLSNRFGINVNVFLAK